MRAITIHEARQPLTVADHADPTCGTESVIVQVAACGLCRSDWHVWHGGWAWEDIAPAYPLVMGHEMSGTVVEVGAGVREVHVGDRVIVPFHFSCGRCRNCHAGLSNICLQGKYPGSDVDGGFAEFIEVSAADFNCVRIPDHLDLVDAASLGCRYMTAWRAVTAIGRARAGETAAVWGCGGLGLSIIEIGTALGLEMIAVDLDDAALARAELAGAVTGVNPRREDASAVVTEFTHGGAALTFDAIGNARASVQAVNSLKSRGRHVQVGLTSDADAGVVGWPADRVVFRELQIMGSIGNALPDYDPMVKLIETGRLHPGKLAGERFTLDQAAELIPELDTRALGGLATAVI